MHPDYRKWVAFLTDLEIEKIPHTQKNYLGHLVAVYHMMESYGQENELCRAGLFHSIYGTEKFQGFKLPLDRRGELAALIGERAEHLAYWNCLMDRASFDSFLSQAEGEVLVRNRETGEPMRLNKNEYDDLCGVHLFDWLEQAPRSTFGWDYRFDAFQQMARRAGPRALEAYASVFSRAPGITSPSLSAPSIS